MEVFGLYLNIWGVNKELLFKGISRLFVAILFAFIGPVMYTSAVRNEEHPFFIPVLGLSLIHI